ncbi:uncharacterized protein BCR38DRAFT_396713 [Pseudomassariella vexata]|uniref:DUF4185 domain-containing protein n=1 Tax=Pseudomassariella vexata TaxID=1141098 RepID=A0A1Y2DR95_9PEZI|nr:uncharacterized protein BCR38DRAFT_396713 [Pseudomassariella vexata]ORY61664.1 hypothetical protein BCR38DRAFT_396713 [Pseudomassariella vexata]
MLTKTLLSSLSITAALASPLSKRARDNTQAAGTNPIKFTTQFLGNQVAENSCSHRDLGFTGKIKDKWYAVWGDALWCAAGVSDPEKDTSGFHGMVRDAVSVVTGDPLKVHDLNLNKDSPVPHQNQFVPFNTAWGETNMFGFGGTSLCEVDYNSATGVVFYLVNANEQGLKGAGVGKVEVLNGTPTVTKRFGSNGFWWDQSQFPRYGDVAAYRDENSDFIYAWGGPPTRFSGDFVQGGYNYLTRVKASSAFDMSQYEYYYGASGGWIKNKPHDQFGADVAVFWNVGQGQMVYSQFYKCYIFVHLGPGSSDVFLRTATKLEGPWTPDVKVFHATPNNGGLVYAGVAHPYLDTSGQTLVISYTNNNKIEVIKVKFSK